MNLYKTYKRDKFLEKAASFLVVSFFSNTQVDFITFSQSLYLQELNIKAIRSRSIYGGLSNYFNLNLIQSVNVVSHGPVILITPKCSNRNFLEMLTFFREQIIKQNNMSILFCCYKGKIYNPFPFLNQTKKSTHLSLIQVFSFSELFLLKVLLIYQKQSD